MRMMTPGMPSSHAIWYFITTSTRNYVPSPLLSDRRDYVDRHTTLFEISGYVSIRAFPGARSRSEGLPKTLGEQPKTHGCIQRAAGENRKTCDGIKIAIGSIPV